MRSADAVPDAPVYRASLEEMDNLEELLASAGELALRHGAVRIDPPPEWVQPPLRMARDSRFFVRIQSFPAVPFVDSSAPQVPAQDLDAGSDSAMLQNAQRESRKSSASSSDEKHHTDACSSSEEALPRKNRRLPPIPRSERPPDAPSKLHLQTFANAPVHKHPDEPPPRTQPTVSEPQRGPDVTTLRSTERSMRTAPTAKSAEGILPTSAARFPVPTNLRSQIVYGNEHDPRVLSNSAQSDVQAKQPNFSVAVEQNPACLDQTNDRRVLLPGNSALATPEDISLSKSTNPALHTSASGAGAGEQRFSHAPNHCYNSRPVGTPAHVNLQPNSSVPANFNGSAHQQSSCHAPSTLHPSSNGRVAPSKNGESLGLVPMQATAQGSPNVVASQRMPISSQQVATPQVPPGTVVKRDTGPRFVPLAPRLPIIVPSQQSVPGSAELFRCERGGPRCQEKLAPSNIPKSMDGSIAQNARTILPSVSCPGQPHPPLVPPAELEKGQPFTLQVAQGIKMIPGNVFRGTATASPHSVPIHDEHSPARLSPPPIPFSHVLPAHNSSVPHVTDCGERREMNGHQVLHGFPQPLSTGVQQSLPPGSIQSSRQSAACKVSEGRKSPPGAALASAVNNRGDFAMPSRLVTAHGSIQNAPRFQMDVQPQETLQPHTYSHPTTAGITTQCSKQLNNQLGFSAHRELPRCPTPPQQDGTHGEPSQEARGSLNAILNHDAHHMGGASTTVILHGMTSLKGASQHPVPGTSAHGGTGIRSGHVVAVPGQIMVVPVDENGGVQQVAQGCVDHLRSQCAIVSRKEPSAIDDVVISASEHAGQPLGVVSRMEDARPQQPLDGRQDEVMQRSLQGAVNSSAIPCGVKKIATGAGSSDKIIYKTSALPLHHDKLTAQSGSGQHPGTSPKLGQGADDGWAQALEKQQEPHSGTTEPKKTKNGPCSGGLDGNSVDHRLHVPKGNIGPPQFRSFSSQPLPLQQNSDPAKNLMANATLAGTDVCRAIASAVEAIQQEGVMEGSQTEKVISGGVDIDTPTDVENPNDPQSVPMVITQAGGSSRGGSEMEKAPAGDAHAPKAPAADALTLQVPSTDVFQTEKGLVGDPPTGQVQASQSQRNPSPGDVAQTANVAGAVQTGQSVVPDSRMMLAPRETSVAPDVEMPQVPQETGRTVQLPGEVTGSVQLSGENKFKDEQLQRKRNMATENMPTGIGPQVKGVADEMCAEVEIVESTIAGPGTTSRLRKREIVHNKDEKEKPQKPGRRRYRRRVSHVSDMTWNQDEEGRLTQPILFPDSSHPVTLSAYEKKAMILQEELRRSLQLDKSLKLDDLLWAQSDQSQDWMRNMDLLEEVFWKLLRRGVDGKPFNVSYGVDVEAEGAFDSTGQSYVEWYGTDEKTGRIVKKERPTAQKRARVKADEKERADGTGYSEKIDGVGCSEGNITGPRSAAVGEPAHDMAGTETEQVLDGEENPPAADQGGKGQGKILRDTREFGPKCHVGNLNRGGLLRHMPRMPGINHSMYYVGQIFTRFCWHVEDAFLNSVSYLHRGSAEKIWYAIPPDDAKAFEAYASAKAFSAELVRSAGSGQALLMNKTTIFDPRDVRREGIRVFRVVHKPGSFVLTAPRAYHAGFNSGFNIAEAVNFANPTWFPVGREASKFARENQKPLCVPWEYLLFHEAKAMQSRYWRRKQSRKTSARAASNALILASELVEVTRRGEDRIREYALRKNCRIAMLKDIDAMVKNNQLGPEFGPGAGMVCSLCGHACHFYAEICASCDDSTEARCEQHFGQGYKLCNVPGHKTVLVRRHDPVLLADVLGFLEEMAGITRSSAEVLARYNGFLRIWETPVRGTGLRLRMNLKEAVSRLPPNVSVAKPVKDGTHRDRRRKMKNRKPEVKVEEVDSDVETKRRKRKRSQANVKPPSMKKLDHKTPSAEKILEKRVGQGASRKFRKMEEVVEGNVARVPVVAKAGVVDASLRRKKAVHMVVRRPYFEEEEDDHIIVLPSSSS